LKLEKRGGVVPFRRGGYRVEVIWSPCKGGEGSRMRFPEEKRGERLGKGGREKQTPT